MAGKRLGEQDKARVHELVDQYARGDYRVGDGWADPRSHHAAQPARWIRDLWPEWVCLEQVPPVLDLWRHIGEVMRGWGYSVKVQVLNSADYGVPQTRERAILIASRVRPVTMPETTHERDPQPSLFGERRPWVSMAEALGWSDTAVVGFPRRSTAADRSVSLPDGEYRARDLNLAINPAPVLTEKARSWKHWALVNGAQENATERAADEPAGTIYCSRPGNLRWALTRPATTVQGDPRIGRPGHKDREGGEAQFEQDSLRVTVTEAAVLQSFPANYPWHGNKTSQFLQVGNAVPPRLAAAVIGAAAGIDWPTAVDDFYRNDVPGPESRVVPA